MRIVHLAASAGNGGAASAAGRLHAGMLELGADSSFLALDSDISWEEKKIFRHQIADNKRQLLDDLMRRFVHNNRTNASSTHFSQGFLSIGWHLNPLVQEADVIQLHWLGEYLSALDIYNLRQMGKRFAIFLHDCRYFTGGCHFPSGCQRFITGCGNCPQLQKDVFTSPFQTLFGVACRGAPLIASNNWLLQTAITNRAFSEGPICVAPDDMDPVIYSPGCASESRKLLGLPADDFIILLGAADPRDERKGIRPFLEFLQSGRVCFQTASRPVSLVTIGPSLDLKQDKFPCHVVELGVQTSQDKLVEVYRAADVLALPSLEDNSPLMALGAMACGTPVVAFEVGGIPELLSGSGYVTQQADWKGYFQGIMELSGNCRLLEEKKRQAREVFLAGHQSPSQAAACLNFYDRLLPQESAPTLNHDFFCLLAEWHENLVEATGEEILILEKSCREFKGGIAWRDNLNFWRHPKICISRIAQMFKIKS